MASQRCRSCVPIRRRRRSPSPRSRRRSCSRTGGRSPRPASTRSSRSRSPSRTSSTRSTRCCSGRRREGAVTARILVVDDTPANVKLLSDLLATKGYEVATAVNGTEALRHLSTARPDLVLLDVMMPDLSGYDVCRAVRANPDTALLPVVLVTSLDPQQERVKGIEAGADDFLSKPINRPEL